MPELIVEVDRCSLVIEVGGVRVCFHTSDARFMELLHERYAGFISSEMAGAIEFDVDLHPPQGVAPDADVRVTHDGGRWFLERIDFLAQWDPASRYGSISQSPTPYSVDAVLRIVHTLVLASQGGFLLHSASAVRNGKAFLFSGVSGAGKTTISRLAPADVALLSDEISYIRKQGDGYVAFGTPFAGELAKSGENISAPISHLYLLAQGPENRIEPLAPADALRSLLANVLFFAEQRELVQQTFQTGVNFVSRVPVSRLTFVPDSRVWELIQ